MTITVHFLRDFHEATVMLSKSHEPKIFRVWPMLDRLLNICMPVTTDSEVIAI